MTNYYEVLCIESTANREEIAAAYRKLAIECHPMKHDKTSFPTNLGKLNSVSQAYEVLSDPQLRNIFDKYGYQSLHSGIPSGPDNFPGYSYKGQAFKIFESFFGYSSPHCESFSVLDPYQCPNEAKADDLKVTLQCTLFEMYNGATKELKYERAVISFDGEVSENKTKETLKVEVKPGFGSHTTLVFPGAGDERYGAHPSDLIVNIEQVANDSFRRNGDNLIYTHKIQLVDALSPKPFHVTTLDSRTLALVPPQVVSPQTTICIENEGMPCTQSGNVFMDAKAQLGSVQSQAKGSLTIEFDIEFPQRILQHHKDTILGALAQTV